MAYHKEEFKLQMVSDALNRLTVDDLKKHPALLPGAEKPTRKVELVTVIARHLEGDSLRRLWERLDETHRTHRTP